MFLTQSSLIFAALLQPLLESTGLHIVAFQECPQDVQNQCRRPGTPLREEIVLVKFASRSS